MRRGLRAALATAVLATAVIGTAAAPASAYNFYECRFNGSEINVSISGLLPTKYKDATRVGIRQWQAANTDASIHYANPVGEHNKVWTTSTTSLPGAQIAAVPKNCGTYTNHQVPDVTGAPGGKPPHKGPVAGGEPPAFWTARLATFYWNLPSPTSGANVLTTGFERGEVATHEIGHALGLAHVVPAEGVDPCTVPSIMQMGSTKFTCGWGHGPYADDIAGVKEIY